MGRRAPDVLKRRGSARWVVLPRPRLSELRGQSAFRPRVRALVARADLDRTGGVAQCDWPGARRPPRGDSRAPTSAPALKAFRLIENPGGEAGCERLLAMNALDSGQPNTAEVHARRWVSTHLNDPWGKVSRCCCCPKRPLPNRPHGQMPWPRPARGSTATKPWLGWPPESSCRTELTLRDAPSRTPPRAAIHPAASASSTRRVDQARPRAPVAETSVVDAVSAARTGRRHGRRHQLPDRCDGGRTRRHGGLLPFNVGKSTIRTPRWLPLAIVSQAANARPTAGHRSSSGRRDGLLDTPGCTVPRPARPARRVATREADVVVPSRGAAPGPNSPKRPADHKLLGEIAPKCAGGARHNKIVHSERVLPLIAYAAARLRAIVPSRCCARTASPGPRRGREALTRGPAGTAGRHHRSPAAGSQPVRARAILEATREVPTPPPSPWIASMSPSPGSAEPPPPRGAQRAEAHRHR